MTKKLLLACAALFFTPLTLSCGYDGYYRYSCQDPDNWGKEECQRPLCEIGTGCSDELTGRAEE
jgi:hypothetical protein